MRKTLQSLLAIALLSGPLVANAGLVAVTGGHLVNDTDHNITWAADANLFLTQATQSGNPAAFVATIISDWSAPFVSASYSGVTHSLTAADFDTAGGNMTWFGATAWVNYLNVTNYQGYSDWRLPDTGGAGSSPAYCGGPCYPSNSGYPISSSEWWELFSLELGGVFGTPLSTTHNASYALFTNVQFGYWSDVGPIDRTNDLFDIVEDFGVDGAQGRNYTTTIMESAWPVRKGLSMVPPPPMAHLVLAPATGKLSFGNQLVGTVSPSQTVTVTSTGTGAAAIAVAASGDFVPTNNCPASLAPGANCTVGVTFNPTGVDARTGSLTVTAGAVYPIALSGTGTISASLVSSASTVTAGVPVTLTWTSSIGAVCTASGGATGDGWKGTLAASGTMSVTEATAGKYTYGIQCTQGSQTANAQAIVTDTVPTVSLSASPTNLSFGQPTTLTWTSSNATSCTASSNGAGDGWTGTKATNGTASISESTVGLITYTLTCSSGPQSAKASAQAFNNAKPSSGGGEMSLVSLIGLFGILAFRTTRRRLKIEHI
jgi:hypothetical protein